jgi:hypothetical protein
MGVREEHNYYSSIFLQRMKGFKGEWGERSFS